MGLLPSGLSEVIVDDEDLARFLTSSSHFNSQMAKPAAFLPQPHDRETSIFRHGNTPLEGLREIGFRYVAGGRNLHGAAIFKAHHVRAAQLDVVADEPPPRHAAIRNWPWFESDPELQKAKQKEMAAVISSEAKLVLL
ncbi:MAG: hypothetical protein OEV08_16335 [Nitrospira sp.]|nr:hypothetical protein [Nitrospira sp.]